MPHVAEVDEVLTRALAEPLGHAWTIANHVEDVPLEEIGRRFESAMGG